MRPVLKNYRFCQVGFVVNDIEEAKQKYAFLFGAEVPATSACDNPEAPAEVNGEITDATAKLAFFNLTEGVQLELIEPNDTPSAWRDALNEKGEGLHHIAFFVEDMDEAIRDCTAAGMKLLQQGLYSDLKGRYAYMDGQRDYKCIIELLKNF